jgi:hypothetical protein
LVLAVLEMQQATLMELKVVILYSALLLHQLEAVLVLAGLIRAALAALVVVALPVAVGDKTVLVVLELLVKETMVE